MVLPPSMQSSLPAGWLAFTGRELNPLDRYKRFQIIHPPFLDLAWRKGSFIMNLPLASHHSITSSARASSGNVKLRPSRLAVLRLSTKSHSPSSPSPLRVGMAGVGRDRPQDWIVGVALLRAAIKRLAIEGAKRHIEIETGYKDVGTEEGQAKREAIGARLRDGLVGAHFVEAVIG